MSLQKFVVCLVATVAALGLAGCGISDFVDGINAQVAAPQLQLAALYRR